MSASRLTAALIVRDEEAVIERCIRSIKQFTNNIVIVDTGSKDRTVELCRAAGAEVYHFKWCDDFSVARNYSFGLVKTPYAIWLDADDVVREKDAEKIVSLLESAEQPIYFCRYHIDHDEFDNPTGSLFRERILRMDLGLQWIDPVHEYVKIDYDVHSPVTTDIEIHQYRPTERIPSSRNLSLISRRDSRSIFYRAKELYESGELDKALLLFLEFYEQSETWWEDRVLSAYRLALIHYRKGDATSATEWSLEAIAQNERFAEGHCLLGQIHFDAEQWEDAVQWFENAARLELSSDLLGFYEPKYYTWLPHLQLAVCYGNLDDLENARHHNEQAARWRPTDPRIIHNRNLLLRDKQVTKKQSFISLSLIVRDEEAYLERCVKSFGNIYDELVIVDTGSTDRTVEIAEKLGARVERFTWVNNFSAARNYAISKSNGQWILMPDGDEYLADGIDPHKIVEIINKTPEHIDNILIEDRTLVNGQVVMTHLVNRIYRNKPEVRWVNRIHETLAVPLSKIAKTPEIYFFHETSKKRQPGMRLSQDRSDSYIEALLKDVEEDPKNARSLFYLANTYNERKDFERALEVYAQYFPVSFWNEEQAQGYYNAAYAAKCLKKHDLQRSYLFRGLEKDYRRAEIYIALGDLAVSQKDMAEAVHWYKTAARCQKPTSSLFLSELAYKDEPWVKLSKVYVELGKGDEALYCMQEAAKLNPQLTSQVDVVRSLQAGIKPVTIIIPSKTPELCRRCLTSIYARKNETDFGVIVVVDGDSEEFRSLSKEFPPVLFVQGHKPFIFSRNINLGITHSKNDVILLNDDAEIETDNWIDQLRSVAHFKPEHGIVSSLISVVGNPRQSWSNENKKFDAEEEPSNLMFVCVYIKRDVIKKIGLLDEAYVWYGFEDNDYSVRARRNGFKLFVSHKTKVRHDHPHSSFNRDGNRERLQNRAMSYFLNKHTKEHKATVLYFTWNRLEYTQKTLPRLLDSLPSWARVTVFDNNSKQDTIDYLRSLEDERLQLFLNHQNSGLSNPTNWVYMNAQTEFVAKVDNDTLVPDGWLEKFLEAHEKWGPELGVVSGFHFLPEDWKDEYQKNLVERNGVKILKQSHVGGCCYAMRRSTFLECGQIPSSDLIGGWTEYQQVTLNLAKKIVGYLFPLVYVDHLDDPRHPQSGLNDDYLWQTRRITREQCSEWYRRDAQILLGGNWVR